MSWNRACEGGHVDVGTGRFSLVSVLTVLHVWKYDFHLWQRSVGACQHSPHRRAFLPPKMTHPGFKRKTWKACHLPGPRAKRRMEELTSFSLPTSHSAQHPSPLQPQLTFLLGAKGSRHGFASSHRFLRRGVSPLSLESIPNLLSTWNMWGSGGRVRMAA